eukprot:CAMPEP_0172833902 /NCGR_PEP_ID=MMETSP1075-20121228/24683_1 /TAXON_ID=2916 /ORGANISM="Ceratium fusus, Strain PA161109" /LENGTH=110 /DNA_ID=CAMNT_0013676727 /DNA_START=176 /DNA_END=505 /DNA_ORIENTATION=+
MTLLCQATLYFCATNIAMGAVPHDLALHLPKLFRFLDLDGNGVIEAYEVESFVYQQSVKLLCCVYALAVAKFCSAVKKPPRDWKRENDVFKERESMLYWYWHRTSTRFCW